VFTELRATQKRSENKMGEPTQLRINPKKGHLPSLGKSVSGRNENRGKSQEPGKGGLKEAGNSEATQTVGGKKKTNDPIGRELRLNKRGVSGSNGLRVQRPKKTFGKSAEQETKSPALWKQEWGRFNCPGKKKTKGAEASRTTRSENKGPGWGNELRKIPQSKRNKNKRKNEVRLSSNGRGIQKLTVHPQ